MKIQSLLFAALVAGASIASAQTFKPEHKYVEGDKDTYAMKVNATSSMGEVQITMDMTQSVKKVYENGDADIESNMSNMVVDFPGGQMHPNQKNKPTVVRYTKFGVPVTPPEGRAAGVNFSQFGSYFGDKELKVGETYTIEQSDAKNPKNHSKGTVKLLSVENEKAKIAISVDNYIEGADKPMHVDGTVTVNASNGKLIRFEGKAKDLPGSQAMPVTAADFVMEKKS
jgi:hypothetical protein